MRIVARGEDGGQREFQVVVRIDTPQEAEYYRHGGILRCVLRRLVSGQERPRISPGGPKTPRPLPAPRPAERDALVDDESVDSFPASDPPAY